MKYLCIECKKEVEFENLNGDVSCPYCSGRVFLKLRPKVVKKVKAR